jgi:hypothetical protein
VPELADEPPGVVARNPWWKAVLVWAVSTGLCLAGLLGLVSSATFPRAIASYPVRVEATVTAIYEGGFSPDPSLTYRYVVNGVEYTGSSDGNPGGKPIPDLHPGDLVAIEYAASAPDESCSCDARREAPMSMTAAIVLTAFLSLPLLILMVWRPSQTRLTRPTWFQPLDAIGEWLGFLLGGTIALLLAAYLLLLLVSTAIQP